MGTSLRAEQSLLAAPGLTLFWGEDGTSCVFLIIVLEYAVISTDT